LEATLLSAFNVTFQANYNSNHQTDFEAQNASNLISAAGALPSGIFQGERLKGPWAMPPLA